LIMDTIKIPDRNTPKGIRPRNLMERRVAGLREYAEPSEVKVYNASGELLRVEQTTIFPVPRFNNRRETV